MLTNIFLAAIATIQLSSAVPMSSSSSSSTNEALTDAPGFSSYYFKRYQLFDSILLKINEITTHELMRLTSIYPEILEDYNEWLLVNNNKANSSQLYKDLQENLEIFVKTMENFESDRTNCELQRKLQTTFFHVENIRDELNNKEINLIWQEQKQHIADADIEELKRDFVTHYFRSLSVAVGRFLQSLNNTGREDNVELIKWCNKFLSKVDINEKLEAFEDIQDLYAEELERETTAGDVNCRLVAQLEWREKIVEGLLLRVFSAFQ